MGRAIAHQVELAEDVGATLHIEPNDTPRAGEQVLAWFALVKKGGETIPLADCDCEITVYARADRTNPIATPAIVPVNSEGYQNIPGATFTFPEVGAYTLTISGQPNEGASFQPFELAFDVTVATEASATSQLEQTLAADSAEEQTIEQKAFAGEEISEATPAVEESTGETGKMVGIALVGAAVVGAIASRSVRKSVRKRMRSKGMEEDL